MKSRPKAHASAPVPQQDVYVLDEPLETARKAWMRLPRKTKLKVVRQLVEEHAEEFKARFKDLIAVAYGYRATGRTVRKRIIDRSDPCVGFLVARKFKPRTAAQRERRLPGVLLSNIRHRGKSVLVAVPTDVESVKIISRPIKAQNIRARVTGGAANNLQTDFGILAGVFKVPQEDDLYALSCYHVLALTAFFGGQVPNNVTVTADDTNTYLGVLSRYVGKLAVGASENFDGALAQVDPADIAALRSHVTRGCTSILEDAHDLSESYGRYQVFGKRNRRMDFTFSKRWRQFPIEYLGIGQVTHPWLIQSERVSGDAPEAGDSGAPVIGRQQTEFVGMHIAGDGAHLSFMIAAPDLLDATNYGPFSDGQRLRLQTDF